MSHVTFTELRTSMAKHFDRVEQDRTELVVTRQNHEPVVLMPLAELVGLRETIHLLSTPANAEQLLRSVAQLDAGQVRSGASSRSEAGFLISGVGRLPILAGNRSSFCAGGINDLIKDACRSPFNRIGEYQATGR